MLIYNQKKIVILSLIISIMILLGIHLFLIIINEQESNENHLQSQVVLTIAKPIVKEQETTNQSNFIYQKTSRWRIQIPTIQLDAAIQEGTTNTIMRQAVGHFENTAYFDGNICLAAHNRGYKYNYFQWIKNLKIGDTIIYQYNGQEKIYEVKINTCIQETDWTYLQNSTENKITLITCAENMPEYRICVQAEEVKKGER